MVVPNRMVKGGIAAVVNGYRGSQLEKDYEITYVESYKDGSKFDKLLKGICGYFHFAYVLMFHKPDLVHIHSSFGPSFYRKMPFIYMASWRKIPIINHIHGADFDEFYVNAPEGKKAKIKNVYSKCNMLISLSEEWKERLSRIVPEDRIEIIENYSILHEDALEERMQRECNNTVLYLQEAIQNRGNQAITHHLLNPTYQKRGISIRDQDSVNTLVTESYIRTYMDYFDATIPSGLSCGIYTYDYLSANTPLSNVFFWIKLYKQIGLFYFTSTCSIELLQMIVTSNEQLTFLCSVRTWISTELCEKYLNSDTGLIRLISKLKKRSDITMLNFNLYLNRICLVTEEIENLSIHKMKEETSMAEKEKTVFVVHGRNLNIKRNVFAFLRSLDIYPLEWEGAVKMTNKGAPSTLEVIKAGMKNSKGIIVIFTGDDEAKLKEEFWE
jgi:glycosyltransferase involved in cell wall biosynthesis